MNGKKNPTLLFDTSQNLSSSGGSLVLGSAYLRRLFYVKNANLSVNPSLRLSSPNELIELFQPAWRRYNNGADYPGKVVKRIPDYAINAADSIF